MDEYMKQIRVTYGQGASLTDDRSVSLVFCYSIHLLHLTCHSLRETNSMKTLTDQFISSISSSTPNSYC